MCSGWANGRASMLLALVCVGLPRLVRESAHNGANRLDELDTALANLEAMEDFEAGPEMTPRLSAGEEWLQSTVAEMVWSAALKAALNRFEPCACGIMLIRCPAVCRTQERERAVKAQTLTDTMGECVSPEQGGLDPACYETGYQQLMADLEKKDKRASAFNDFLAKLKKCASIKDDNVYSSEAKKAAVGAANVMASVVQIWSSTLRIMKSSNFGSSTNLNIGTHDPQNPGWTSATGDGGGVQMISLNFPESPLALLKPTSLAPNPQKKDPAQLSLQPQRNLIRKRATPAHVTSSAPGEKRRSRMNSPLLTGRKTPMSQMSSRTMQSLARDSLFTALTERSTTGWCRASTTRHRRR